MVVDGFAEVIEDISSRRVFRGEGGHDGQLNWNPEYDSREVSCA